MAPLLKAFNKIVSYVIRTVKQLYNAVDEGVIRHFADVHSAAVLNAAIRTPHWEVLNSSKFLRRFLVVNPPYRLNS